MLNKLNFGCGDKVIEGWVNFDRDDHGQEIVMNALTHWPFKKNEFDIIVANHVLHQFTFDELETNILPKLFNSLKKNGTLRILDMNPAYAFKNFSSQNKKFFPISDETEESIDGKFCKYLTWYSTRKSIITPLFMQELLKRTGFGMTSLLFENQTMAIGSKERQEITKLDSRYDESFIVEGMK